ncbi:MAG: ABC transporter ATP-binding protein, partial [Actinobacteria bacterium]|nr:ABC transporter ATP-binding protein [Actinomycetota bacterium]
MSTSILSLKNVTMRFGGVTALNDVTFDVKEKEILGLIGPNGAGKTTVFNVITGVYQITSGSIEFQGKSLAGEKRYKITRSGIARTFQNIRLWGDMTALENVMTATDTHKRSGLVGGLFGSPISRKEEKRDKKRAQELLDFIGIGEYADRLARNLPYGVQRRL